MSIDEPPICGPKLPPSILTPAGGLHPPPFLRQEAKPRPYFPPTTNAPFLRLGTITTHCALSNRSRGIPFSGTFMMSPKDSAALWIRLSPPFGVSAPTVALRQTANRHVRVIFIADSLGLAVSLDRSGDQSRPKGR